MGHRAALLLAAGAVALAAAAPADAATKKVRKAPGGTAFYTPPAGITAGAHGSVIWARTQTGPDALKGASARQLVLYRSSGLNGPTAVSASVSLPKGKMPKSGWPVVAYDHGTTGIADQCAPTRNPGTGVLGALTSYAYPLLNRYLKAGFAVVRTDYEGLGTPGDHPYLIGTSEAHATLDSVRAARKLLPGMLSAKFVVAGHSQGGQAALWAGSLARSYTPELKLRGVSAFAPVSNISDQAALLRALTSPGGLTGLAATILRGLDLTKTVPALQSDLTPQAAALYPQTLTACLPDLDAPTSFGGIAPADLVRSDVDIAPIQAAIDKTMDPENLAQSVPVRIDQGEADSTVFPMFTDSLDKSYAAKGINVDYVKYPGLTHGGVVTSTAPQIASTAWIKKRLG